MKDWSRMPSRTAALYHEKCRGDAYLVLHHMRLCDVCDPVGSALRPAQDMPND